MGLFWLSFCDPDRPKGQQFLGVSLVEIDDIPDQEEIDRLKAAVKKAWATGCNPGGEVQSVDLPLDRLPNDKRVLLAKAPRHTLMDRGALEAHGLLD